MIEGRDRLEASEAHAVALDCIEAGIEAARPDRVVGREVTREGEMLTVAGSTYDLDDYERVVVLGGGKAADAVAAELESVLGEWLDDGLVVATDPTETETVDVAEGAHPVPDAPGRDAAQRVFDRASEQGRGTLVLVPVTGGGSALLPLPAGDISLDDLRTVTEELVESGAAIAEINAVRKHLSEIKGGGLARAAAPATVVGLLFMSGILFGVGIDKGADLGAAENRTGLDHMTGEMNALPGELTSDLRANSSGVEQRIMVRIAKPVAVMTTKPAAVGLRVGYRLPLAGQALGPAIVLGGLGGWGYSSYRRIKQGGER